MKNFKINPKVSLLALGFVMLQGFSYVSEISENDSKMDKVVASVPLAISSMAFGVNLKVLDEQDSQEKVNKKTK